jgi:DNA-binding winged helix-turn-helix (wHTH) protein/serine/threonine protein kinase
VESAGEAPARRWSFGPAVLDERTLEFRVNGEVVTVERKPLEVLLFLLHHAGEVVTKDEILEAVWPGRILSETVLTKCISRLREALGDEEQLLIKTQHGYGYRLIAPVQVEASAAPPPPRFDFKPGDSPSLRPRWKLEERLGTGGHGEAWLARHDKTREARVFKFALDSTALGSLKREITIYRLLHDALPERTDFVSILDWNLEEPPYFLESEHAGLNLVQWAKAQAGLPKVPLETRLEIAAQIAAALAAAHSVGVLHKDLKPSNVLIVDSDPDPPKIKLSDFGSGGVLDPDRLETLGITRLGFTRTVAATGTTSGTPIYFAPEVIAGQPFTVQADIYALGVMFYQLVVGDLKRSLATGWEREIEDELLREDIIASTEGDLARRLTDAADVAKRLRVLEERRTRRETERNRQAQAKSAEAEAERSHQMIERLRSRRRWLSTVVAVLAVGVAISSGMYFFAQSSRKEAEQSAATARAVIDFLTGDVLSADDPRTGLVNKGMTVREALEHAADKVNKRFADKPEVAARVHFAIAMAYMSLGDTATGQQQIDRANALEANKKGPVSGWEIVMWMLGTFRPQASESIVFSEEFCRTLAGFIQRGVEKTLFPEMVRQIHMVAALCRITEGNYQRARLEFQGMLEEALRADPPDYGTATSLESLLAGLSYMEGDLVSAERHVRSDIAHSTISLGKDHHHTIGRRLQRVHPLALMGRFDEAEQELREIQTTITDEYPARHQVESRLAALRFEQGRLEDAENHLLSYLEQLRRRTGESESKRDFAFGAIRLGELYLSQGRVDEAIRMLKEGLAGYEPSDRITALIDRNELLGAKVSLADALRKSGQIPAAWQVIKDAAKELRALPDKHPALANVQRVRGLLLVQEGQATRARAVLTEALQIYELRYGPNSWRTKRAREELARVAAVSAAKAAGSS